MIYPFDCEFSALLRHKSILKDYKISSLVAPNGWGTNEKDAGCEDGGPSIGIIVTNNFNKSMGDCDTILFTPRTNNHQYVRDLITGNDEFNQVILKNLHTAICNNKNIICTMELDDEDYKSYSSLCRDKNLLFNYYVKNTALMDMEVSEEMIEEISSPIICVFGIGERQHKFDIQLALREYFIDLGYQVGQIGTKNYCELLGFHSFPEFMFSTNVSESNKVVLFNRYVKRIEIEEKPDVIIIGIPGGFIPYDNEVTNRFGITAFLVSNAITPDASICSVPFEPNYNNMFFEHTALSVKHKLGIEIDCFNLSNIQFDWYAFQDSKTKEYLTLDNVIVDKKIEALSEKPLNKPIFNILNDASSLKLVNLIYKRLEEYGTTPFF